MNMSIKEIAANAKKAQAKGRGGGPKSDQGKFKSSLNAVRHGLSGKHLLLPGEDPLVYAAKMDAIFSAFAPQTEAEAQLVALCGDDLYKLDRLERIETGLSLGRIEQLFAQTETAQKTAKTAMAVNEFGEALIAWESTPAPKEWEPPFGKRLTNLVAALGTAAETFPNLPVEMVSVCELHIGSLAPGPSLLGVDAIAVQGLSSAAAKIMHFLLGEGDRREKEQSQLRAAIAGISLPDEGELKKLARYRKLLEEGLQRRLQALEQIRTLQEGRAAEQRDDEKAKAFRVQLRLVH